MADKRISELTAAANLGATDLFVIVQGGNTLKIDATTLLSTLPHSANCVEATESFSTNGSALTPATAVSKITVNTGVSYTLAAGTHGLKKTIVCNAKPAGTSSTVTVSSASGGSFTGTLTFSAVGQTVTLKNIDGAWYVEAAFGATAT